MRSQTFFVVTALVLTFGVSAHAADRYLQRIDSNETYQASKSVKKSNSNKSKAEKSAHTKKSAAKASAKSAAQKAAKISAKPKQQAPAKSMSRDVVFDGSTVNGRYHSAGEAVASVETEKKLNDLIGARKDFKDRLAVENARLKKDQENVGSR